MSAASLSNHQGILIVNPQDFVSLTAYSHLSEYISYHRALKIYFSALEYYLYVGDEYLQELDSLVYDEVTHLHRDDIRIDLVSAMFNVIIQRTAKYAQALLRPFLFERRGVISSIELISPVKLIVKVDLWQRGTPDIPPAFITSLLKQRFKEIFNEESDLHHRDFAYLVAGIRKPK